MRGQKRDRESLQERLNGIWAADDMSAGSRLCTASLEWTDGGSEKEDFFGMLRPFVEKLDKDSMEAELFLESESKDE